MLGPGFLHTGAEAYTGRPQRERFGTTITCKHVLSCDIDEARQDFIRKAHPDDVSVLMSDCSQFSSGKVRCILQDKDISIPETLSVILNLTA